MTNNKNQIQKSNNPTNPNSDKKFANQFNQNNQLQSTVQTNADKKNPTAFAMGFV
jgi:hypothetical protein